MSDDMLIHFSSNSSNQSDQSLPTKIAKLEARMVGKASSAPPAQPQQQLQQSAWSSLSPAPKFATADLAAEPSTSSDSDDDNGGEFLIQANTQKRQKLQEEDCKSTVFEHVEAVVDVRQMVVDTKANSDVNRKKRGRGRANSVSGRGRGSRVHDQTRLLISPPTVSPQNGELENSYNKISSSDDDEANEDLSLKIVEKALLMRAAKLASENDAVAVDPSGLIGHPSFLSSSPVAEVDTADLETRKVVKKGRVRKNKKMKIEDPVVILANEEGKVEAARAVDETNELNNVQITDNIILRKLLRGPRYFDPPDRSWGTCFNCGEEGHAAVNCAEAKRKKPCFVCGSLEHNAKQCEKGQDCFICKKGGHHAKNCPEKYKGGSLNSKICLKCGDFGHEMYLCKNDYPFDDLKEIQCYVCKRFGHLCCVKCVDYSPKEVSCYKCGEMGHTGLACIGLRGGENTVSGSPRLCFKCGEGGHIARECTTSTNARKRYDVFSKVSTPLRPHKEKKDGMGFYSAPHDLNKYKRKHTRFDEGGFATPQKAKHRGGWLVDDPEDFSPRKGKNNSWKSPATPSSRSHRISSLTAGGHASTSRSSKKLWKVSGGTPISHGSSKSVQHRYSASRFRNSGADGIRRNNDRW